MRATRHLILAIAAALLLCGCAVGGKYGDVKPTYADRGATVVAEGVPTLTYVYTGGYLFVRNLNTGSLVFSMLPKPEGQPRGPVVITVNGPRQALIAVDSGNETVLIEGINPRHRYAILHAPADRQTAAATTTTTAPAAR